ncbi:MAG: YceI family protein [Bacteroidia bacterium]
MKKISFLLVFSVIFSAAFTQTKYFTKSGNISFYSVAEQENIEAHSNRAVSIFEKETGAIEFSVLIKSFQFEKALMQEHFNENYMESEKFPKANFKGNSEELKKMDLTKDGTYTINVSGKLTIHGETKNISTPMTFVVKSGIISATSEFKILLKDYNIKIPSAVGKKIAEEILIKINIKDYKVYEK